MILQALKGYYDRAVVLTPDNIAPYAYSDENISFALVISAEGDPLPNVECLLEQIQGKKKPIPTLMPVPRPPKRTSGEAPCFLWDKPSYVLGVGGKTSERTIKEHEEFRKFHLNSLEHEMDLGLRALYLFVKNWHPNRATELVNVADLADGNVVFRLDGHNEFIHDRPAAQTVWRKLLDGRDLAPGQCLITGQQARIEPTHASIKRIDGAQSSGASIISFNLESFCSYGKLQGANAPSSEAATSAYTIALNQLLRSGYRVKKTVLRGKQTLNIESYQFRNRVQIADATTVFWAEGTTPKEAQSNDAFLSSLFNPADDASEDETTANSKLSTAMGQIADGRPIAEVLPDLKPDTSYYALGLSPNAARISVRFWHQSTLGNLAAAMQQHWQDLRVEPVPWRTAPAIRRLLRETVRRTKSAQDDNSNIQPNLAGEVMRAVLTGNRYPRTLITSVITRIRADGDINGLRAAILKACLIREEECIPVSLDRDNLNRGYRLGRLFAVLDATQYAGVGKVNAGIRDKYVSAASATPRRVFPLLLRGAQNHLASARKRGKGGRVHRLELDTTEIMSGLDANNPFPTIMPLSEQGHFFVGFYHQQAELKVPRQNDETIDETEADNETTE